MKSNCKRILSCLLSLSILSSCTPLNKTESSESPEESNTQISLSWWGDDQRVNYTMDAVDIFEEKTGINVECKYGVWNGYKNRQNIFMYSNEEPDVMLINFDWISKYSPDGYGFYDLYKLSDEIDLSNFDDNILQYGVVDGMLNALPTAMNSNAIFINKTLYEKYGLDVPQTWDDYFEAAKLMREDGVYPLAIGDKALFFFLLAYCEQSTGRTACNENGELQLTLDEIKLMLSFYKKMKDEKAIMPVNDSSFTKIVSGEAAGTMRWISGTQNLLENMKDGEVVVAPYPKLEGAKSLGWYAKPATMYAISENTDHPEEAAKLLDFLLNSEEMALLQKTEKGIPASKAAKQYLDKNGELEGIDNDATEQMLAIQSEMRPMVPILESEDVYGVFIDDAAYYLYAGVSLEETAQKIYNQWYAKK